MVESFNRTVLSRNIIHDRSHVSLFYLSILLAILPILVLFFILFKWIKYIFLKNKRVVPPLPPGPPPTWPILGCVPDMLRNRPVYKWNHSLMTKLNTHYNKKVFNLTFKKCHQSDSMAFLQKSLNGGAVGSLKFLTTFSKLS